MDWNRLANKVVFLTGSTGNLGTCLLYQLILHANVSHVYILVRRSSQDVVNHWQETMGQAYRCIAEAPNITMIHGDMTDEGFGIPRETIKLLSAEVNIIIHAAADINLMSGIDECVGQNCDPLLELAALAEGFKRLDLFVHVSTAYANSFKSDGTIEERLYNIDAFDSNFDPEQERKVILENGASKLTKRFAWPYALSKYLAELLLISRHPKMPLLIVRPSIIGPAYRAPFQFFGAEASLPLVMFSKLYVRDRFGSKIWHVPDGIEPGSNVLDEIPVDWVANMLLLHIVRGTRGVVHATAGLWKPQTFNQFLSGGIEVCPEHLHDFKPRFDWVKDRSIPQCPLARMYAIGNRDWRFSCDKSMDIRHIQGPISIKVTDEEVASYKTRFFIQTWAEVSDSLDKDKTRTAKL